MTDETQEDHPQLREAALDAKQESIRGCRHTRSKERRGGATRETCIYRYNAKNEENLKKIKKKFGS